MKHIEDKANADSKNGSAQSVRERINAGSAEAKYFIKLNLGILILLYKN